MVHAHDFQIWQTNPLRQYAGNLVRLIFGFFAVLAMVAGLSNSAFAEAQVNFTAEEKDGYARLIFEFEDRFVLPEYEVNAENGVLVVRFDETVTMTLPLTSSVMGNYISVMRMDPDGLSVRLGLIKQFKVNQIAAGERLFIDMMPMDWQGLPPSLPNEVVTELAERSKQAARLTEQRIKEEIARKNAPKVEVSVGRHPTFTRLVFDWSFPTEMEYSDEDGQFDVDFEWPTEISIIDLTHDLPATVTAASANRDNDGTHVRLSLAEGVEAKVFKESTTRYLLDIYAPESTTAPMADIAALETKIEENAQAAIKANGGSVDPTDDAAEEKVAAAPSSQEKIKPFVNEIGDTVRIVFPFEQDTAAAVFERAGTIWLLFDTHVGIDKGDMGDPLGELVNSIDVDSTSSVQIMRLKLTEKRLATLGSEGRSWVLSLGDILFSPTEPVSLERRRNSNGVFEAVSNLVRPSRIHSLRDPNVGDVIKVITAYPPARGFIRPLEFVEFQVGKSVHGMVVKRHDDDITVNLEQGNVVIGHPEGLFLSARVKRDIRGTLGTKRPGQIQLDEFIEKDPRRLFARREKLIGQAGESEAEALDEKRIEIAKLFVANGLGAEALGVLNTLEIDSGARSSSHISRILKAAANIQMYRFKEAVGGLSQAELMEDPDAAMWRTIAAAGDQNWSLARESVLLAESVRDDYPVSLRHKNILAGMRAAVELEDFRLAGNLQQAVDLSRMNARQLAMMELLAGRIDHDQGRLAEAVETYGRVMSEGFPELSTEAELYTILALDQLGQLEVSKAIDSLANLALSWRGDELEAQTLNMLGQLYFREHQYREGFETMKTSAFFHGDSDNVIALQDLSAEVFSQLFLDGEADRLDPIDALSLYYDFKNLTPPGTRGDDMIRNLARRLVKVDLLGQAADLLEYQIGSRLKGAARAQIAADLAIIHIANQDPTKALQAIYRTRISNLPQSLNDQRRLLEAKALIDGGRDQLALEVLQELKTTSAQMLRVDAHWAGKRYQDAAELLERRYAQSLETVGTNESARMNLLKAAVGYTLAGDQLGLSRLRSKFADEISKTPEWPMFDFVTDQAASSSLEFRTIARDITGSDNWNSFIESYRERYSGNGALVPNEGADSVLTQTTRSADAQVPADEG